MHVQILYIWRSRSFFDLLYESTMLCLYCLNHPFKTGRVCCHSHPSNKGGLKFIDFVHLIANNSLWRHRILSRLFVCSIVVFVSLCQNSWYKYISGLELKQLLCVMLLQELNFSEDQIQSSDALVEMSQGQWEGCLRSEIYTPDMVSFIERCQPDFSAPSGESLRQVEFRMIEFINYRVLRLPEKLRSGFLQTESKVFSRHNSQTLVNSVQDRDGPTLSHWDLLHRHHRQGLSRKNSGKSRLQVVTTGDNKAEDELSPREEANHRHLHEVNTQMSVSSIAIFTHATPIKCLITGLLGCSPMMSHQICIDDSSTTVLQHSLRTGWQIKRLNDTAHLRLL